MFCCAAGQAAQGGAGRACPAATNCPCRPGQLPRDSAGLPLINTCNTTAVLTGRALVTCLCRVSSQNTILAFMLSDSVCKAGDWLLLGLDQDGHASMEPVAGMLLLNTKSAFNLACWSRPFQRKLQVHKPTSLRLYTQGSRLAYVSSRSATKEPEDQSLARLNLIHCHDADHLYCLP